MSQWSFLALLCPEDTELRRAPAQVANRWRMLRNCLSEQNDIDRNCTFDHAKLIFTMFLVF